MSSSMKILVIDDMSTMRKIIKKILTNFGLKNLSEANDGTDALKKIKADTRFKTVPFLMVTAEGKQKIVVTAVKAGVSNFIVKPFSEQIFKEKIDKIFNK